MHDYSIDTAVRRWAHVIIAVVSLSLPAWITSVLSTLIPGPITFPISFGATFFIFYMLFEHLLWKWLIPVHGIANLNGDWTATGTSSYKDPETGEHKTFSMVVKIKQTFSRLEVFTDTAESTSRSFMASLELEHAVPIFRYGYDNTPKNMSNPELQRHPGMMDLRLSAEHVLEGDYFSGKHRLRYGELVLRRNA
jgi:hypothetical protein